MEATIRFIQTTVFICCLAVFSIVGNASELEEICPQGFVKSPSAGVCLSKGSSNYMVFEVPPFQNCTDGYERLPGIQYCIISGATLDMQGKQLLVSENTGQDCPSGFQRYSGSTICLASDLVLEKQKAGIQFTAMQKKNPYNSKSLRELTVYYGPPCRPNFMRPPGIRECIARSIVYSPNSKPLIGLCPKHWVRPAKLGYCIPSRDILDMRIQNQIVVAKIMCLNDKIPGEKWSTCLGLNPCPDGTVEVWWNMPLYDKNGNFLEFVPARACIAPILVYG